MKFVYVALVFIMLVLSYIVFLSITSVDFSPQREVQDVEVG